MIESEKMIKMRCDKCGGLLLEDYGHAIRIINSSSAYFELRETAIDLGWYCKECCLCPSCRKELGK